MTGLAFTVQGTPRPQPRPRFVSAGGRVRAVSTASHQVQFWRNLVQREVRAAVLNARLEPLSGPLSVAMVFGFAPPKSDPGRSGPHTQRPDADNLAKLVMDVMQSARVFADDAQISELRAAKLWTPRPGLAVTVQPVSASGLGALAALVL